MVGIVGIADLEPDHRKTHHGSKLPVILNGGGVIVIPQLVRDHLLVSLHFSFTRTSLFFKNTYRSRYRYRTNAGLLMESSGRVAEVVRRRGRRSPKGQDLLRKEGPPTYNILS